MVEESLSTPLSKVSVETDYEKRPKCALPDPIVLSHPEPMTKRTKKGDGRGKQKRRHRDVEKLVVADVPKLGDEDMRQRKRERGTTP
jgi:hypothetical protein